jgi:hypothetical protein
MQKKVKPEGTRTGGGWVEADHAARSEGISGAAAAGGADMINPPRDAVIMIRPVDPDETDRIRADTVSFVLHRIITDLKVLLSPADYQNWGIAELEAFTAALHTNGKHPSLNKWVEGIARGGRPAPSLREVNVRRVVMLMCEALRRAGLTKRNARRFVAGRLERAGISISTKVIEHWGERDYPLPSPLAPTDEVLISTALATSGLNPERITTYFLGLFHLISNPTATIVRDAVKSEN